MDHAKPFSVPPARNRSFAGGLDILSVEHHTNNKGEASCRSKSRKLANGSISSGWN